MSRSSFENRAVKDFVVHQRDSCFYFSVSELIENAAFLKTLEDEQVKFIFPVKSFPHAKVLQLMSEWLSGFDVSNATEYELIRGGLTKDHIVWSSSPVVWNCPLPACIMDGAHLGTNWRSHVRRSLRVRLGDLFPDHRSRFGTSIADIDLTELAHARVSALHFHHGQEPFSHRALELATEHMKLLVNKTDAITHVNLGGGFAGLSGNDIRAIVTKAKKTFPNQVIVFEPGRWICGDAGILLGKIADVNLQQRRGHATTTLSRDCHLRWQRDRFEVRIRAIDGGPSQECDELVLGGATCSESDKIGTIGLPGVKAGRGNLVIVLGVSGYSVAWNHSFNGIAAADVVVF